MLDLQRLSLKQQIKYGKSKSIKEGGIGFCGIAVLDNLSCGTFNLELGYCGILQTCGMQFFFLHFGRYTNSANKNSATVNIAEVCFGLQKFRKIILSKRKTSLIHIPPQELVNYLRQLDTDGR